MSVALRGDNQRRPFNISNRDVRTVVEQLESVGWEPVRRTGSGHLMFRHDDSEHALTIPSTPSDHRWAKNALAQAERLTGKPVAVPDSILTGKLTLEEQIKEAKLAQHRAASGASYYRRHKAGHPDLIEQAEERLRACQEATRKLLAKRVRAQVMPTMPKPLEAPLEAPPPPELVTPPEPATAPPGPLPGPLAAIAKPVVPTHPAPALEGAAQMLRHIPEGSGIKLWMPHGRTVSGMFRRLLGSVVQIEVGDFFTPSGKKPEVGQTLFLNLSEVVGLSLLTATMPLQWRR